MDPSPQLIELAQHAARLVVEEGLDYASARRKALQAGGGGASGRGMPALREHLSHELIEDEVRAHIAIFHADTQPTELRILRECACRWMHRLAEFRPHLGGAVWRGTATRLSGIRIDLFCDDPKAPEIALINLGVDYDLASAPAGDGRHAIVYTFAERSAALQDWITLHLSLLDHDDLRGALKPDARGRTWRGDLRALERCLQETDSR